ncbi:MAG: signal recognition particle-docking protein FtsY [Deltaproteobacteria bacterium]|nr:signal recognition particle-docking protein FtsY [Deltaproteobacteria bacterium]MBW2051140.1 signal recognition particle-docking protein FtsY [Deltaproteobacteria bacterium]
MIRWFKRAKKEEQAVEESVSDTEENISENQEEGPQGSTKAEESDLSKELRIDSIETSDANECVPEDMEDHEEPPGTVIEKTHATEVVNNKKGFLARLKERLAGTRAVLTTRVDHLVMGVKEIGDDVLEDLEEILITSDLGVQTTKTLIKIISDKVARRELNSPDRLKEVLREEILKILSSPQQAPQKQVRPLVILVVGVNGVGKTTTIAKLARRFISQGQKVMLVAADTFRAAAVEQLQIWSERVGADIVKQQTGADPSAVVFDALHAAQARNTDIVIIDTAGRLHTKVNLMEELKKIKRISGREMTGAPHEVLLVLDSTTGQNAVSQAKLFNEAVGVTQLAMTKLDGTAKGGILVAIAHDLNLPIRYIGLGEQMDDLTDFEVEPFVEALFG